MPSEQNPSSERPIFGAAGQRPATPEAQVRALQIIWLALVGASLMFFVIALTVPVSVPPPAPIMPYAFAGVCVVILAVSYVLPAKALAVGFGSYRDAVVDVVAPAEDGSYRGENVRRRVLRLDASARRMVVVRYQTPLILAMSLSESIACMGLVLDRIGFPLTTSGPFFAAGTVLILARLPMWRRISAHLCRVAGADVVESA